MDSPAVSDASLETPLETISIWRQVAMNLFWFANNLHWQAILGIVIPSAVETQLPFHDKGLNLALVVAPGTVLAFVVNPLVGSLSDYARFRMGRRRPFMIVGTMLNVAALAGLAYLAYVADGSALGTATLLVSMSLLFVLLQFSNNFANSPWSAIIADQVPQRQRGSASGFYGLMTLLGTIAGFVVAGSIISTNAAPGEAPANTLAFRQQLVLTYAIIAAIQIIFAAITVLGVPERPLLEPRHFTIGVFLSRFRLEVRKYPDFAWILLTRLLIMTGIWSIYFFLLYYFQDVLGITGKGHGATAFGLTVESPQQAQLLFLPITMLTSALTVYFAGWLSDRVGRKVLVYIAGAMMSIVAFIFIFFQTFPASLVAAAFFGLGYGAYTSVDWALATDVLPPTDEAGKHMGLWSAAGIIPQVVGVTLGGIITYALQQSPHHLGYTVLFSMTVLMFLLGTLLLRQVKGAH
jgi:MFS family permease